MGMSRAVKGIHGVNGNASTLPDVTSLLDCLGTGDITD